MITFFDLNEVWDNSSLDENSPVVFVIDDVEYNAKSITSQDGKLVVELEK